MVLRAVDLSKVYGDGDQRVEAVSGISVEMAEGEFLAIVGPSGSGKTTLLALLAGLLRPTQGRVFLDSLEVSALPEKARSRLRRERMGFVFQENNLLPYLTALENVFLAGRLAGRGVRAVRERANRILEDMGLGSRLHHLPHQLSGGERQRVAIARALCHDPQVIFLDEPTSRLDSVRGHGIIAEFAATVKAMGKTAILVTHDLSLCRYADRVLEMTDGKAVRTWRPSASEAGGG